MTEVAERRASILDLESQMAEMPQIEIEVRHYFAHGTYTREAFLPAGTILTGKIHRHSCINIISKGRIRVATEEGSSEIQAPYTFVSGPGIKKAGLVLEDTVWLNVLPWDGVVTDIEALVDQATIPTYELLDQELTQ